MITTHDGKTPHPIDQLLSVPSALTTLAVLIDAHASLELPDDPVALQRGVVLLADAIVRRLQPHLPTDDPALAHLTTFVHEVTACAAIVRERYDLPRLI